MRGAAARERRSRRAISAPTLLAALLVATAAAPAPSPAPAAVPAPAAGPAPTVAPAPAPPRSPLAITLRGGVSLGTYEAGLTWALVQAMRAERRAGSGVDLAAATGASAGSVNALLAAVLWCEEESEQRDSFVADNLFHDAWAPVGVEDLLPDDPADYARGDGLLRSEPLERQLAALDSMLSGPHARRLRPGCAVPYGLSVTRTHPEERDVSGLRARAQRFVVPMRFEVGPGGKARIRSVQLPPDQQSAAAALYLADEPAEATGSQQLFNAILASGAFPLAFRTREHCDCALSCPEERTVRDGQCAGPAPGQPLTGLSCAATTPKGARTLCRRSYVDGGILDNAPVGLAIDLADASGHAAPLQPTTYLMFDPDFRRYAPPDPEAEAALTEQATENPIELFNNLVATARSSELSSAIRADDWNRTTRRLLAASGRLTATFSALRAQIVAAAMGEGESVAAVPMPLQRHPERERIGRVLLRCLREMNRENFARLERLAACAAELRQISGSTGSATRLEPVEVAELAHLLLFFLEAGDTSARRPIAALLDQRGSLAERISAGAIFQDGLSVATFARGYLDGELDTVARSALPAAEVRAFRADLLRIVRASGRTGRAADALLHVWAAAVIGEEGGARGQEIVQRLLATDQPEPVDSPGVRAFPQGLQPASSRLEAMMQLAPRLRAAASASEELARTADRLAQGGASERQLLVSRRFSPLASSSLYAFAGFLDRGLRELDYLIGVYDTAIAFAGYRCANQGPYETSRPAPAFRGDNPLELDAQTPETWRCVGAALRDVLDVDGAGQVWTTLGVLPTLSLGGVAFSAGPRASYRWGESVHLPGFTARLALAQERLALSAGVRSLARGEREWSVVLGVSDLNGLAYWFSPWPSTPTK